MSTGNGHATSRGVAYVTVAASQASDQVTIKLGTYISHLVVQPETTSPGTVVLEDGTGTDAVTVYTFPGGTDAVGDLAPFIVPFGVHAGAAAEGAVGWHVTTGANVNVIAVVQVR